MLWYTPNVRLFPPRRIRCAIVAWGEQSMIRGLPQDIGFSMLQEGSYPLFPIPAHSGVLAASQLHTCFAMDLIAPIGHRVIERGESSPL